MTPADLAALGSMRVENVEALRRVEYAKTRARRDRMFASVLQAFEADSHKVMRPKFRCFVESRLVDRSRIESTIRTWYE